MTCIRDRTYEESRLVALILYNMYWNVVILIYVCIKSNLLTLELL